MACNACMHVHIAMVDSLRFWFAKFGHVDTDMLMALDMYCTVDATQ